MVWNSLVIIDVTIHFNELFLFDQNYSICDWTVYITQFQLQIWYLGCRRRKHHWRIPRLQARLWETSGISTGMLKICQHIIHQNVFETKISGLHIYETVSIYCMHAHIWYWTLSNYLNYLALQRLNDMFNEPTFVNNSITRFNWCCLLKTTFVNK